MPEIAALRDSFPFLSNTTYLNTAAAGVSWTGLASSAARFYESKIRGICARAEWSATLRRARSALAGVLAVPEETLTFTGSATEALNLAILGLPLGAGSRIVIASDEFPSVVQPCLLWQARGVEVSAVPIAQESQRTSALAQAVADGAQAVAVSHVHWRTGTRVDLEHLGTACRKHGAWLIADGVQAVGAVAVEAGRADAYCGSSFKWLLGGFGLGFLSLGERLAHEWTPPLRGYANEPPSRSPQYGHINYPGIYALDAALEFLGTIGWAAIHRRVCSLACELSAALTEQGLEVITPSGAAAGIVSVRHDHAGDLVRQLTEQQIFVEERDGIIRASPHFYNTEDDLNRFIEALIKLTSKEWRMS